uniref:NaTx n=1 Tax=Centruroides hentzi TaxID=88313 RepID=A0A2I9LPA5_9SCOR
MNYFILILVAALLILDVDCKKDAYPLKKDGCTYDCWRNAYCDQVCKDLKAEGGYCYAWRLFCWCTGLPDNVRSHNEATCRSKSKN